MDGTLVISGRVGCAIFLVGESKSHVRHIFFTLLTFNYGGAFSLRQLTDVDKDVHGILMFEA